ncbi:hypothetical protein F5Y16DRAFT_76509 [Xylariaceae sp. FL0255]|nr:hypothetical protein F5Y16DRAFT_76509 [Xylariaceae sp. FL0255]
MFGREEDEKINPRIEALGFYTLFTINLQRSDINKPMVCMYVGDRQGCFAMTQYDVSDKDLNCKLGSSTEDESTWSIVQTWVKQCSQEHPSCDRKHTSYVPDRLVEFSEDSISGGMTFRVVGREQVDLPCRYVTLTHCWNPLSSADDDQLMLTSATSARFSEQRPVSILPQVCRDLASVARKLDVRYAWVDRFCRLNDGGDLNWRKKASAETKKVLENSFLDISASGALDDEDGLFFSRDPSKIAPGTVNLGLTGPENPKPYRFDLEKGWAWRLTFNKEPLIHWEWSLQERLFAPRVLHFGRT